MVAVHLWSFFVAGRKSRSNCTRKSFCWRGWRRKLRGPWRASTSNHVRKSSVTTQRLRAIFASTSAGMLTYFVPQMTHMTLPMVVSRVTGVVTLLVAHNLGRARRGRRCRRLGSRRAARGWNDAALEGPAPPAGGPAPSLDLVTCGPSSRARTTSLARLSLPERCGCSRAASRLPSAAAPPLTRTGTGRSAPDEPIGVIVFFLGAMAMKNC